MYVRVRGLHTPINSRYNKRATCHCWEREEDLRILRTAGFEVMALDNGKTGVAAEHGQMHLHSQNRLHVSRL